MEISKDTLNGTLDKGQKAIRHYTRRENMISLLGYILVFILIFLMNFMVDPTFTWDKLGQLSWLIPNVIIVVCIVSLTMSRLNERINELKAHDQDLLATNNMFGKLVTDAKYNENDLASFLNMWNHDQRVLAYREKVENKITRLNRSPLATSKALRLYLNGDAEAKENNLYCKKRLKLDLLVSSDFIEKSIDYMKIRCVQWTISSLMSGVQLGDNAKKVTQEQGKFVRKEGFKKGLSKAFITCICAALAVTMDWTDWSSIVLTIMRLVSLVMALVSANQLAISYVNGDLKQFSWDRIEVFKLFSSSMEEKALEKKKLEDQKADASITTVKEVISVENKPQEVENIKVETPLATPPVAK